MRRSLPLLLSLLLLGIAPTAHAKDGPDATLTLRPGSPIPGAAGWLEPDENVPGEDVTWNLTQTDAYRTVEIRVERGVFDVERPRQVVPTIEGNASRRPLFVVVTYADVWTADTPAQIAHVSDDNGTILLRLGIPGPATGRLVLTRDVAPPRITPGPIQNVTTHTFFVETRTDEPATVDLQTRPVGSTPWIPHPTADYNLLQRFPINGLPADSDVDARLVAEDWAGNNATLDLPRIHTDLAPPVRTIEVKPDAPAPNATVAEARNITASIDPTLKLADNGITFFLDKTATRENLRFENGTITYAPPEPLPPGPHSVSFEVTDATGAHGVARWTFTVATRQAPTTGLAFTLVGVASLALARSRRSR